MFLEYLVFIVKKGLYIFFRFMTNFWRQLTNRQRNNKELNYNHLMDIIESLETRVSVLESLVLEGKNTSFGTAGSFIEDVDDDF